MHFVSIITAWWHVCCVRACSHCVCQKRTFPFTWMRFDHFLEILLPIEKVPLCISEFWHELRETSTNSRFHNFGFGELPSELSFGIIGSAEALPILCVSDFCE